MSLECDRWSPAARICLRRVRPSPRPQTEHSFVIGGCSSLVVRNSMLVASLEAFDASMNFAHELSEIVPHLNSFQRPRKACLTVVRMRDSVD